MKAARLLESIRRSIDWKKSPYIVPSREKERTKRRERFEKRERAREVHEETRYTPSPLGLPLVADVSSNRRTLGFVYKWSA
ncbi:hypothetical protein CPB86DRAFT_578080 [Serendipita vermifera]|nr:hypothetical protein CPB86DRAFT_578080 [Serendipita vermifera]